MIDFDRASPRSGPTSQTQDGRTPLHIHSARGLRVLPPSARHDAASHTTSYWRCHFDRGRADTPYLGHVGTPYLGHAETLPTSVMRRHSLLQADTPYFVTIVLELPFGYNQT